MNSINKILNNNLIKLDKLLVKNWIINNVNTFLANGVQFLLFVLFARVLTQEYFGNFQLIQIIINLLILFSFPGLNSVIFKYSAQNYDGLFLKATKFKFKGSISTSLILVFFCTFIIILSNQPSNNVIAFSLAICGILIPFYYSLDLWQFILKGKEKFMKFFVFNLINSSITFIIVYFFTIGLDVTNIPVLILLYYLPSVLINIIASKLTQKCLKNNNIPKDWKKQGLYLTLVNFSSIIYSSLAPLLIGFFLSVSQLAIYIVAFQIINIINLIIKSTIDVVLPRFFRNNTPFFLKKITIIFFISFLIPITLSFFIEFPIIILFGDNYKSVIQFCQLFLFAIPFYIVYLFLANYLIKFNLNKEINLSRAFSIILTFILYIILIPLLKIYGAIIGSISYFLIEDFIIGIFLYSKKNKKKSKPDSINFF